MIPALGGISDDSQQSVGQQAGSIGSGETAAPGPGALADAFTDSRRRARGLTDAGHDPANARIQTITAPRYCLRRSLHRYALLQLLQPVQNHANRHLATRTGRGLARAVDDRDMRLSAVLSFCRVLVGPPSVNGGVPRDSATGSLNEKPELVLMVTTAN